MPLYRYIQHLLNDKTRSLVMPVPCFNVLNGGVHSGNTMAFQEIMICPTGASSTTEAVKMGSEIYHTLKKVLVEKYGPSGTLYNLTLYTEYGQKNITTADTNFFELFLET